MEGHSDRQNAEAGPESRLRKGHPDPPTSSVSLGEDASGRIEAASVDAQTAATFAVWGALGRLQADSPTVNPLLGRTNPVAWWMCFGWGVADRAVQDCFDAEAAALLATEEREAE